MLGILLAMLIAAAPNFERPGVVHGFVLAAGSGLTPTSTKGTLFAQGTMYRPSSAPTLPATDNNAQRWLFYNTSGGFYWKSSTTPTTSGDAGPIGWVVAAGGAVILTSTQQITVPDVEATTAEVITLGVVLDQGPGTNALTYGDTDIPARPSFNIDLVYDGTLHFLGLGFPSITNTQSISMLNFWVYSYDEVAAHRTALAADIGALDTTITVPYTTHFSGESSSGKGDGHVVAITKERIRITSIAVGSPNDVWTVVRGILDEDDTLVTATRASGVVTVVGVNTDGFVAGVTKVIVAVDDNASFNGDFTVLAVTGSASFTYTQAGANAVGHGGSISGQTRKAHLTGVLADRCDLKVFNIPMQPQLVGQGWTLSYAVPLPFARVATVQLNVLNAFGLSATANNNYLAYTDDGGLTYGQRTAGGGQYILPYLGTLAILASPAPPIPVQGVASIRDVYAIVAVPSTGSDITVDVKRNGSVVATLTIAATAAESNHVSGAALAPMVAGDLLTFDITGVGSTWPGAHLTVVVRI